MTGPAQAYRRFTDEIEGLSAVDGAGEQAGKIARERIPSGAAKDALSGTWLTHAVHPPLTAVVIGSFFSATLLDLTLPDRPEASERLLVAGIVAAVPTAATGLSDWADAEEADPRVRRVGVVHAAANVAALVLAAGSLVARRRGSLAAGRALSGFAMAALGTGGFLGGHLAYTLGVGVDETGHAPAPPQESPAAAAHAAV
jgi:uncharacterized membrane protein